MEYVYPTPKITVVAIMKLCKITKAMVRLPNGVTEFFNIVAGFLQGDTIALNLLIPSLDNMLRISIDPIRENNFILSKKEHSDDIQQKL